ncbi:hypothetical protein BW723_16560 [Polaribacter reichenbachii]|uniref:Uncharacterized protein n=1 Tax=Polaribacter reichenbachii TaxID=996801 RepID=A0A1B8TRL7_9FLAO|nr:hypothetical protein [Polaribacter reichenbachii]APZ47809.1 hypothetical protein BW723_16560 [Polaribacter reichenbachii]AUC18444.1 hypothetical protein BTO17_06980 [Polaribacter reichenbachii]OBY62205.1 hypothetical protein LPB301_15085 [Polaribacter reichenbachii]
MKNIIERTLFWFSDGDDKLLSLNERYFSLGNLLNRLLCEKYKGKKLQFINLFFRTEETYKLYPQASKHFTHFYGGQLTYDDVFDLKAFNKMNKQEQDNFIWKRAFEILQEAAASIKNKDILNASEYAYNKGLEMDLNPDFRMIEKDVVLFDQALKAAIWVNFKKEGMYSKFTLEKENQIVFEKEIDKAKNGVEFFLEIYKDIDLKNNNIIIKGRKDVEYLPLKIRIYKEELV